MGTIRGSNKSVLRLFKGSWKRINVAFQRQLEVAFSILTPNSHEARQFAHSPALPKSEAVAPRYTWETGNHRAEPVAVLRRAPTLTDEQRQQRVGSRALSPSELWPQSAKERPRESKGFDLLRSIQLSPGKPDTVLHTVKPLENQQTLLWLHVVPIRMSPWMTDDDPLTKIDNAAALSTNEATENTGTGPGSSRARSKDQSLRSLKIRHHVLTEVSQYLCVHQRTLPQRATELMQLLHRDCPNRQDSIHRRTLHIRRQPQQNGCRTAKGLK